MKGRNYNIRCDECGEPRSACHCSKGQNFSSDVPFECNVLSRAGLDDDLEITEFKNGVRIAFPSNHEPEPPEQCERASTQQSGKSRRSCAFTLGNAETEWKAMLLLSYRVNPDSYEEVKDHRTKFLENMRKRYGAFDYAWFLEFTKKAVAHYHVFIGSGGRVGELIDSAPTETVKRHGNETTIVRGELDKMCQKWWRKQVGDESEEFRKFQAGGILEKLRFPDAAGRYAAKEAGKRIQKFAPWPVRQWWYISNGIRPTERRTHVISVRDYLQFRPDGRMISTHYGKELLKD